MILSIGAVVFALVTVALGLGVYLPVRSAAVGRLRRDGRGGLRTQATCKSDEAWQHGHTAAMIYVKSMPWIIAAALVLGVPGWIWLGAGAGLMVFSVAVACELFVLMFGFAFAVIAARDCR